MIRQRPIGEARLGRREQKKRVTRHDLVLAGRELFAEKGLYEPRIEDITQRAGIAKGTLYRYFRSKEDLILAVVSEAFDELGRQIEAGLEGARARRDVVERIVAAHVEFFESNPDLMRILHQARGMLKFDRPEWRPLRHCLSVHLDRIVDGMERIGPRTATRRAARRKIAPFLFGAISGVASVLVAAEPGTQLRTALAGAPQAIAAAARSLEARERRSRLRLS
jgi:AcrR family transcriptional regulator